MKRTILIFAALLSLSSCHFLEIEKIGKSDIETYFSEVNSLEPAINGVYSLVQPLYDKYVNIYASVASDEVDLAATSATWVYYRDFTRTSSDETSMLGYLWKNGYNAINNCNQIISHAPKLRKDNPHDIALVDRVEAQAYFFRALVHFELVRAYGQNYSFTPDASHLGVPVVNHVLGLTEKISRASVAQVYRQIVADLKKAEGTFPEGYTSSQWFASPLACKALLARVYLYMEKWQDAYDQSAQVMAAKPLTSRDNYVGMFTRIASVSDDEGIFRINGYKQGKSSRSFYFYESPEGRPAETVTGLFTSDDIRASLFRYEDYGAVCMKYCTLEADATDEMKYYNATILRVSEMYLIHAEAAAHLGKTGEAQDDVKALEARARGIAVSDVTLDETDVYKLIATERIKELCFEGHRFYDLGRRHEDLNRPSASSSTVKHIAYPDWRYVLPIPQVELAANEYIINNPTSNE